MTHPCPPLCGREFDPIDYRHCWGEDRVFYIDETEQVRSLPARWTDTVAANPFVVVAAGRALVRAADMVALAKLVGGARR